MKISVPCPGVVHSNSSLLNADELSGVSINGALLVFDIEGESLDDRLDHLTSLEAYVGGQIADADEAAVIYSLGQLKAVIAGVRTVVIRESSYSDAMHSTALLLDAKAASDTVISHSHAEQNTSTADSSEQHGAAPQNEEMTNEQADEEEQGQPAGAE